MLAPNPSPVQQETWAQFTQDSLHGCLGGTQETVATLS